ncbi:concanavalin A-like lectin/glucanase [Rickenella mellea]|uniref:Concanavalin A-like lectin/glucanase n=1 Tax=Rickenella mellea TaxID=50990 RepID=A0A4Y7Q6Z3_9AGAM|nr:concanavalin A-like lectin/glucanase [Rickenella mellea]
MTLLWRLLITLLVAPLAVLGAKKDKKPLNLTVDRLVQLRTHSLYAPYIDQDLQNRWWDFGADSYVNTNKHVRLTRNAPSQMGWLWSRLPITAAHYIIEVEFKISGDSSHLFGDGIAMWLTKTRAQPGPIFGSIDKFEGLGIFLDTYANARHSYAFPRVTATLGDGKTDYDFGEDGDGTSLGACSANYRRTNVATKLKLIYIKDTSLEVKIQHKAWDDWTDCFKVEGITIPSSPFLGFSAMTGDVSDAHDIISVTTSSAMLAEGHSLTDSKGKTSRGPKGTGGSWAGFLFKLMLFAGVCVGGVYGYQAYAKRNGMPGAGGQFYSRGRSGGRFGGYAGGVFSDGKRF